MRAFLDACVLYPPLVRGLLVGAAEAGLYRPSWSARVLDEWQIAVARAEGIEGETAVDDLRRTLRSAFPEAEARADPRAEETLALPDPADAHVVAAAAAAGARTIVTMNLRDFPARPLAAQGLVARHPDGFLWELLGAEEAAMAALIRARLPDPDPASQRRALKRARLPRLGKAWEALAHGLA